MTKKKDREIPAIPAVNADDEWEKSLATMPDGPMKRMLRDIREKQAERAATTDMATDAKQKAAEFHAAVPASENVQERLPFAPMTTDLCRVSFFFPMNRREKRDFIENLVVMKNAWGEMQFLGPRLSTYEEDVFLAALALAKIQHSSGGAEYIYDGPMVALVKTLVRTNHPSTVDYRRVYRSLRLLMVSALEIRMNKQNTVGLDNILTSVNWDKDTRRIKIVFNPYFAEKFLVGTYTLLGIEQRLRLRGPVAKALHRFVSSQRETWTGHYLTLAGALNLSAEQHGFTLRRMLKGAITELVKGGVLCDNSGFANKDQVLLKKIPAKPARKVKG